MRTNKLDNMLKQMSEQQSMERQEQKVPADIQVELHGLYQSIEQGQSADRIREQLAGKRRQQQLSVIPTRTATHDSVTEDDPKTMTANRMHLRYGRVVRYGMIAAAVMVIGVGSVLSSAFFSADMARTLKQVPGTQAFYQLTSTWGWIPADEKETTPPQQSVEQNGIKLTLHSLLYDGKSAVIELEQKTLKQRPVQQVEIFSNGQSVASISNKSNKDYMQDTETSMYTLQRDLIPQRVLGITDREFYEQYGTSEDLSVTKLPQKLDLQIRITLRGMTDQPFVYNVHAQQQAPISDYKLSQPVESSEEGIRYTDINVEATPITTYIQIKRTFIKDKEAKRYSYYLKKGYYPQSSLYALTDSEDHIYRSLGVSENDSHITADAAPLIGHPDELIITPWRFNEQELVRHRPIPVNADNHINMPLTVDLGTTGKVTLLDIQSTTDQYVLRIQPEEAYQAYTSAASFWYGKLNSNPRQEVYASEIVPDREHEGQFLLKFNKSKIKNGNLLYYAIDKVVYQDPLYVKRTNK